MMCFVMVLNAQVDSVKVTQNGLTESKVKTEHSASVLYNKTLIWVNETYKNPDKVLSGKIENKSVTISGYAQNAWYYKNLGMPMYFDISYHLYITISDSIVNFKILIDQIYTSNGQKYLGTTNSFF